MLTTSARLSRRCAFKTSFKHRAAACPFMRLLCPSIFNQRFSRANAHAHTHTHIHTHTHTRRLNAKRPGRGFQATYAGKYTQGDNWGNIAQRGAR